MKLEGWLAEPWRCPQCARDEVMVRDVQLPGGQPGNIRRETTVIYAAKCVNCSAEWMASFEAVGLTVLNRGTILPLEN